MVAPDGWWVAWQRGRACTPARRDELAARRAFRPRVARTDDAGHRPPGSPRRRRRRAASPHEESAYLCPAISGCGTVRGTNNSASSTLATSGSNESLDIGILPRRARGCEHFLNPHRLRGCTQTVERVIAIVDQVSRRLVPRKGLAKLLGRPRRRRMGGYRHVPDASPIMGGSLVGARR